MTALARRLGYVVYVAAILIGAPTFVLALPFILTMALIGLGLLAVATRAANRCLERPSGRTGRSTLLTARWLSDLDSR